MVKKKVPVKMERITRKTALGELIIKHPETAEVFLKYGLPCAMCHMASGETVEQAAEAHGLKADKLLVDLNKSIKKK